jgi:hypothetical protein
MRPAAKPPLQLWWLQPTHLQHLLLVLFQDTAFILLLLQALHHPQQLVSRQGQQKHLMPQAPQHHD